MRPADNTLYMCFVIFIIYQVALSKLLFISVPQCLHLKNGYDNNMHAKGLLLVLNRTLSFKHVLSNQ